MTRICDYEGSKYRTEFWENENRDYEDLAERIAIRHMLPSSGHRIIEVGAGFGRLVDMYDGYDQIILTDYARTQLEEAQRFLGHDDRFIFVVSDVYKMPFVDSLFDALVMIRVMHHLVDVPSALKEIQRITHSDGVAIIEHASKRHIKSVLRWLMRRQEWNPFSPEPHEFVELNIDFHPGWMRQQFSEAQLDIQDTRSVSYYRVPMLKDRIPAKLLASLDGLTQPTGRWFQYAPSNFLKASPKKPHVATVMSDVVSDLFRCPSCLQSDLQDQGHLLHCSNCGHQWAVEDGIYDFKTPLNSTEVET